MNRLKDTVLFDEPKEKEEKSDCIIKNWKTNKEIKFKSIKDGKEMKFDSVIGNSLYQESDGGVQASARPVYQHFFKESIEISDNAELTNNIGTELNDDNLNAFVIKPNTVCTESHMLIGVNLGLNGESATNLVKIFKSKFARFMHSLAKASQGATSKTDRFVPLQDFTENSNIDWTKSIAEIDKQLYKKYNLSQEEIDFIEIYVKPQKELFQ